MTITELMGFYMKNSNTTSVIWEYPISHTRGPKETCRIEKTKLNRVDTENFLASFKQAYIVLLCVLILFSLSFVFIATSRAGSLERPLTTRLPSMENNITDLMNSFMLETIESFRGIRKIGTYSTHKIHSLYRQRMRQLKALQKDSSLLLTQLLLAMEF